MVEYSDHRLVKKEKMPKKVNRLTKEWCNICWALDEATCSQQVDTAPKGWKDDSPWVKGIRSQFGAKGRKGFVEPTGKMLTLTSSWGSQRDFYFWIQRFLFAFDRIRYDSELWCTRKTGPTWGNCRRLVISAQPQTRSDRILHDLVAVRWSGTAKIHHFPRPLETLMAKLPNLSPGSSWIH